MANVSQVSLSLLQPTISALQGVVSALDAFMATNGLNVDSGTTNPAYIPIAQMSALLNIQLGNLRNKQTVQTLTVANGTYASLYEIAAQYYGDVTQAFMLMEVNGLITPWLSPAYTYTIMLPVAQTVTPAQGIGLSQVTPTGTNP